MFDMYQDIYDRRAEHPNYWYNKSSDLRASAGALWHSMEQERNNDIVAALSLEKGFSIAVACWPVYQMNFGMSFELILKAIALTSKLPPQMTHNLIKLADYADVKLNTDEQKVFSVLTESIIWDGRYPTPKNKKTLEAHYKNASGVLFDEHETSLGGFKIKVNNGLLDWSNLDRIWRRLASIFHEQNRNVS